MTWMEESFLPTPQKGVGRQGRNLIWGRWAAAKLGARRRRERGLDLCQRRGVQPDRPPHRASETTGGPKGGAILCSVCPPGRNLSLECLESVPCAARPMARVRRLEVGSDRASAMEKSTMYGRTSSETNRGFSGAPAWRPGNMKYFILIASFLLGSLTVLMADPQPATPTVLRSDTYSRNNDDELSGSDSPEVQEFETAVLTVSVSATYACVRTPADPSGDQPDGPETGHDDPDSPVTPGGDEPPHEDPNNPVTPGGDEPPHEDPSSGDDPEGDAGESEDGSNPDTEGDDTETEEVCSGDVTFSLSFKAVDPEWVHDGEEYLRADGQPIRHVMPARAGVGAKLGFNGSEWTGNEDKNLTVVEIELEEDYEEKVGCEGSIELGSIYCQGGSLEKEVLVYADKGFTDVPQTGEKIAVRFVHYSIKVKCKVVECGQASTQTLTLNKGKSQNVDGAFDATTDAYSSPTGRLGHKQIGSMGPSKAEPPAGGWPAAYPSKPEVYEAHENPQGDGGD